MDEDKDKNWRRFHHIKLNKKAFHRRARKAEGATIRHAHKFIISRWDNIRSVRQHVIIWFIGVGVLIALTGLQLVLFQRSYMMSAPINGGVYAEAVKGPVSTLDPLYASSDAELAASHLLFSSLYSYDSTGHLRGDLATEMKVEGGNKIYTVTLRPNAYWHDGAALTAKDVVFTVNLMKDPATRASSTLRTTWKDITATATSTQTVQFTLAGVNAAFPQALTFSVLPQHILAGVEPQALREHAFSNNPVGSGPFKMKLLQLINQADGRKIVHLSAFPGYYRGEPRVSRFQLHVFGTTPNIIAALRTGEVTATADITPDDIGSIDKKRYSILAKPVNGGVYALLNTTQPLLKDKKLRQALQLGTNTASIRASASPDAQTLYLPFVAGQLTGTDIPAAPAYDKIKAMAALDQLGWKVGKDGIRMSGAQALELHVVTIKEAEYERGLESLAGQWRQLGIKVDTRVIDPNDPSQDFTQSTLQPRDYDVLINKLNIGGDPDVYAYWHSSQALPNLLGTNYSNYSSSIANDALVGALTRLEPDLRNAKYKTFARQWLDDVPAIGLYQANMYYVHTKTSQSITDTEKIISPADRYGGVIYWTVDNGMVYKTP